MRDKRYHWKGLFSLGAVFLLVTGGFWWFENWRGARAWEAAQARAEAAGVSLESSDYVGPEIPDEENLLLNPVFAAELGRKLEDRLQAWAELPESDGADYGHRPMPEVGKTFDYRDYFRDKASEEEARERLAKAAANFEARLDRLSEIVLAAPVSQSFSRNEGAARDRSRVISFTRGFADCLCDSALMALRSGKPMKALGRIRLLDRWSRKVSGPELTNHAIATALFGMESGLIWEGVRLQVWSADQLEVIAQMLSERAFEEPFENGVHHELAAELETLVTPGRPRDQDAAGGEGGIFDFGGPTGWLDQRKAFVVNIHLNLLEAAKNRNRGALEEVAHRMEFDRWSSMKDQAVDFTWVAGLVARTLWQPETLKRIVLLVLKAESLRLARGSYPGDLSELALGSPVVDLTDPQERDLAYELDPEGRPRIWSRYQEEQGEEKLRWQFFAEE